MGRKIFAFRTNFAVIAGPCPNVSISKRDSFSAPRRLANRQLRHHICIVWDGMESEHIDCPISGWLEQPATLAVEWGLAKCRPATQEAPPQGIPQVRSTSVLHIGQWVQRIENPDRSEPPWTMSARSKPDGEPLIYDPWQWVKSSRAGWPVIFHYRDKAWVLIGPVELSWSGMGGCATRLNCVTGGPVF